VEISTNLQVYHLKKLRDLLKTGIGTMSVVFNKCNGRVPLSYSNYSSNRWIKYLDDYFEGGKPLLDLLEKPLKKRSAIVYNCKGISRHTYGPCIISITKTSTLFHINFRTIDWSGAGVLDLNLVWMLWKKTSLPIWVTCPLVKISDWQLATYPLLDKLSTNNSFVKRALVIRRQDSKDIKFWRLRRRLKNKPESLDEEDVILNFPRVTPEDIAYHLDIVGCKVRNILRKHFGYSTKGSKRISHRIQHEEATFH